MQAKLTQSLLLLTYLRLEFSRVPQRSRRYPARVPSKHPSSDDVRYSNDTPVDGGQFASVLTLPFRKTPEVKMYTQMKRTPLDRLTRGKVVLIGDACHPMLLSKS